MELYISGVSKTDKLLRNSLRVDDELQESANQCSFKMSRCTKPTQYDPVEIFEQFEILDVDTSFILLDYDFDLNEITHLIGIGDIIQTDLYLVTTDTIEVIAINRDSTTGKILCSVTPTGYSGTVGENAGVKRFAGNIVSIKDHNTAQLNTPNNVEYEISCVDYTRIFDKELVNDTYEDRDARYIINDFCNVSVNKNHLIDQLDYATNGDIQTEWSGVGGTASAPTTSTVDPYEADHWGVFSQTTGGGWWYAEPAQMDVSAYTGVATGLPTKGKVGCWIEVDDYTKITSLYLYLGSQPGVDYMYVPITGADIGVSNEPVYIEFDLVDGTVGGTPDWQDFDYVGFTVVSSANITMKVAGLRFLEDEHFHHYPYVETSPIFEDFRVRFTKPTDVMTRIADGLGWYWYVDYDKNIHLFSRETNTAPFNLDEDSNNFTDLEISYDISRLINRQTIYGAEETSSSVYSQVVEGDLVVREWIMKNKFKNLDVLLDDGSVTDTMEATTTTTLVKATGHGLIAGDYMVNRTRGNAVRKVLTAPTLDTFTVDAVASQTSGDTFSTFTAKTVGVEGLDTDVGNNYMSNYAEKSIRASSTEPTLDAGDFLLFKYNEVFPIISRRTEYASVTNMVNVLGYSNGVFDGQPIVDISIKSRAEAKQMAQAILDKYSNVVITAKFKTSVNGLKSGQLINIKDTDSGNRNINQSFIIQKVSLTQLEERENQYTVTCSSLLFGMLELLKQLLKQNLKLDVNEDAEIDNVQDVTETISVTDTTATGIVEPPFHWQPAVDKPIHWNLFSWG